MCNDRYKEINLSTTTFQENTIVLENEHKKELIYFKFNKLFSLLNILTFSFFMILLLFQLFLKSIFTTQSGFLTLINNFYWLPLVLDILLVTQLALIIFYKDEHKAIYYFSSLIGFLSFFTNIYLYNPLSVLIKNYSHVRIAISFSVIAISIISLGLKKNFYILYLIIYMLILVFTLFLFFSMNAFPFNF